MARTEIGCETIDNVTTKTKREASICLHHGYNLSGDQIHQNHYISLLIN